MFGVLMITLLLTISLVGSNMDTILKQGVIYQVRAEITENTTIAQGFNDPEEFEDLGTNPAHEDIREKMKELMFTSLRNRRTRTTRDNAHMKMRAQRALSNDSKKAVYIGVW